MPNKGNVMKAWQLSNKAFTAGIIFNCKGVCVDAAPIVRWMIGKGEKWIKQHCRKHHIVIQEAAEADAREY